MSDPGKAFKWTIEVEVAEDCVADGINLTESRVRAALWHAFPMARMSGIACQILSAPPAEEVLACQGYDVSGATVST